MVGGGREISIKIGEIFLGSAIGRRMCNSFFPASYSKMLYEAIFTTEDPDSLRGGLDPDATDRERPSLPKLLQDGGGFHGHERRGDHPASFAGRSAYLRAVDAGPIEPESRSGSGAEEWAVGLGMGVGEPADAGEGVGYRAAREGGQD
jgi:hypothetical protein